jgi:phage-related protein
MAKTILFLGTSRKDIRSFPDAARREVGKQLFDIQIGREPSDWKPMPTVGLGVREIRIRIDGAFRVFYVAQFVDSVYVIHAFQKKSQKTAKTDLELARARFKHLLMVSKND